MTYKLRNIYFFFYTNNILYRKNIKTTEILLENFKYNYILIFLALNTYVVLYFNQIYYFIIIKEILVYLYIYSEMHLNG